MKSLVRPELPTASVGSSQAPTAAVDNSAPSAIRSESTYQSGKVVQTSGATSECSGALILHWKPALIRKLRVPILPVPIMEKIAELATEAKRAKRKSDELLEQAKTRVEQLIEEAVQP